MLSSFSKLPRQVMLLWYCPWSSCEFCFPLFLTTTGQYPWNLYSLASIPLWICYLVLSLFAVWMVVMCPGLPKGFQVTTYSYAISLYQTLTPFAIMHAWSPVSSCMCVGVGEWDSEYVKIMSRLQRVWERCLQHYDAIKLTSHSYASTLHMDSLKVLCYWIWANI